MGRGASVKGPSFGVLLVVEEEMCLRYLHCEGICRQIHADMRGVHGENDTI